MGRRFRLLAFEFKATAIAIEGFFQRRDHHTGKPGLQVSGRAVTRRKATLFVRAAPHYAVG